MQRSRGYVVEQTDRPRLRSILDDDRPARPVRVGRLCVVDEQRLVQPCAGVRRSSVGRPDRATRRGRRRRVARGDGRGRTRPIPLRPRAGARRGREPGCSLVASGSPARARSAARAACPGSAAALLARHRRGADEHREVVDQRRERSRQPPGRARHRRPVRGLVGDRRAPRPGAGGAAVRRAQIRTTTPASGASRGSGRGSPTRARRATLRVEDPDRRRSRARTRAGRAPALASSGTALSGRSVSPARRAQARTSGRSWFPGTTMISPSGPIDLRRSPATPVRRPPSPAAGAPPSARRCRRAGPAGRRPRARRAGARASPVGAARRTRAACRGADRR